jgi:hypothetical protein
MSSIRLNKTRIEHSFSIVPNSLTFSESLSLSEKGALIWLLAKPENFGINTKSLATHWHVGVHTVKRISKKLQETGYLEIQKFSTGETIWHITDTPIEPLGTVLDDTGQHPHVEKRHKDSNGGIEPHVEKPHVGNRHALERTDLLSRTDHKTSCSSSDAQLEDSFDHLWKRWPAKKNKMASKQAFKAKMKGKSPDSVNKFVDMLKNDIQGRLAAKEYAFEKRNLEKYLKQELYNDVIEVAEEVEHQTSEQDKQKAINDKAKRALGIIK